ncbi:Uncharacterised protein [Escherichia coli]|nr:Uncharacterised protein [Escherichia coli]
MACPAIAVSFGPIGVPARRSATLISVVASTAARSHGRTASSPLTERVNQLHVAWRGLRTGGTEAHLGVGDGRDHDTVTAQHRLLQVLKQCFRLLAHDERADVRVEHIDLVHRLTRPSSLTTSSRSVIKSGSAFSSSRNEPQVGRTGRRMMLSPSRTISSSLTPSKSRSRGRRIARLLPFLKMDTVSHDSLPGKCGYVMHIRNDVHCTGCVHMFSIGRC